MKIDLKSIGYAFIANGVQVYFSEYDHFLVSKLICLDCGDSWYMNLTECFICGAINPFLFQCKSCGSFESITKSSKKCSKCTSDGLFMVCANPDCLSNKDPEINKEANGYGGVFNKDSGLLIAQQYCLNCGSKHHIYKTYEIFVRKVSNSRVYFSELEIDPSEVSENTYTIIKYKNSDNTLKYRLYKTKDILGRTFELDNLKDNFQSIVNELFPVAQ